MGELLIHPCSIRDVYDGSYIFYIIAKGCQEKERRGLLYGDCYCAVILRDVYTFKRDICYPGIGSMLYAGYLLALEK